MSENVQVPLETTNVYVVVTVGEKLIRTEPDKAPVITELVETNEYEVASGDTVPSKLSVVPIQ